MNQRSIPHKCVYLKVPNSSRNVKTVDGWWLGAAGISGKELEIITIKPLLLLTRKPKEGQSRGGH